MANLQAAQLAQRHQVGGEPACRRVASIALVPGVEAFEQRLEVAAAAAVELGELHPAAGRVAGAPPQGGKRLDVHAADGSPDRVVEGLVVAVRLDREQRRSEEHTSELQSRPHLVCRLLLEKKN